MTALRRSHRPGGCSAHRRDRGAAAVEMALILPVLLFVLMGLIDFGRAYNTQIQLSQAAREGARFAALGLDSQVQARVGAASTDLSNPQAVIVNSCPGSGQATVKVTADFQWITGISALSNFFGSGTFPSPHTMSSTGVMQCAN